MCFDSIRRFLGKVLLKRCILFLRVFELIDLCDFCMNLCCV